MNVKKIVLALAVVVAFVGYSLGLKHDNRSVKVTANTSGSTGTTSGGSSTASSSPTTTTSSSNAANYKDGTYTGSSADAFYGLIQVAVTIQSGKLTDVQFLQYPNDRQNSVEINQQAMPLLRQEALQAQSAHVDGVSGATDTSQAFVQSLSSALSKAS